MNDTTLAIEAAHTVCYVNDDCVDVIYVNVAVVAAVIVTAAVAVAEYVDGVVCVDVVVTVFRLSSLSGKKFVFILDILQPGEIQSGLPIDWFPCHC